MLHKVNTYVWIIIFCCKLWNKLFYSEKNLLHNMERGETSPELSVIMDTAAKNKRNGQKKVSCHHGHCCQEQKEWTEQGELSSWTLLPRTSGTDRTRWAVIMDIAARNIRNGQTRWAVTILGMSKIYSTGWDLSCLLLALINRDKTIRNVCLLLLSASSIYINF